MKSTLSIVAIAVTTLMTTACSSPSVQESFQKQQQKIEEKQASQAKETLSKIPSWFLDYESHDDKFIYAVGSSVSSDPQTSLDDAKTFALSEIARIADSKLSAQKSQMTKKDASGNVASTSKLVIDELVSAKNMAGNKTIKRELIQEGSKFRAYVMVALPNNGGLDKQSFIELEQSHRDLLNRVNATIGE